MISRSNNDKNEGDGHKLNCQLNSETGTTLSKPLFLKECYDECWENSECKSEKCHCSPVSCSDTIENVTRGKLLSYSLFKQTTEFRKDLMWSSCRLVFLSCFV